MRAYRAHCLEFAEALGAPPLETCITLAPPYMSRMMTSRTLLLGVLLSVAVAPYTLRAQAASDQAGPSIVAIAPAAVTRIAAPCSYADCALRIERNLWSARRLVRGIAGAPVADLDAFRRSEIAPLFAGNDSASTYAEEYLKAARVNRPLTLAGIVLGAVGLAQDRRMNAFIAAGASMLVVSIPFQVAEERALSRAVWWYNSSLSTASSQR